MILYVYDTMIEEIEEDNINDDTMIKESQCEPLCSYHLRPGMYTILCVVACGQTGVSAAKDMTQALNVKKATTYKQREVVFAARKVKYCYYYLEDNTYLFD